MSIKIHYMRKTTSTLFTISAIAIALLMLASPVSLLSNSLLLLLQPVQAQTTVTFQPSPTTVQNGQFALTFEAKGTACSSYCSDAEVTSGTFQMNTSDRVYDSGSLYPHTSSFTNDSSGVTINLNYLGTKDAAGTSYFIVTTCSTSDENDISVRTNTGDLETDFYGPVECTLGGEGEAHSAQPDSSTPMTATTTQDGDSSSDSSSSTDSSTDSDSDSKDGDSDGIPDSSDNCPNHPHHRCFMEGGDTNTTSSSTQQQQQQQQPSSSSSGSRNQTR